MSKTHNSQSAAEVKCGTCALLRSIGVGACTTHAVHDPWWLRGHASPHEAAYSLLACLDEVLGAALPDPLAFVGSLCVARLCDRRRPAVEAEAMRADRTPLGLWLALAECPDALRGAA